MLHYKILSHTLLFKRPAKTSRGAYLERKVWYVFLSEEVLSVAQCEQILAHPDKWGGEKVGVGEIAPLFDLSFEYHDDFQKDIEFCCSSFINDDGIDFCALKPYPSICFGLETAWLSLKSQDGLSFFDTPFSRGESPLLINGLVWMGGLEQMKSELRAKVSAGFKCIKCKIGALDFEHELELLRIVRTEFGQHQLQLRVDANGAYSVEQATEVLSILNSMSVHSIEQPIKAGQWDEMRKLCQSTPVPIALDEELIGVSDLIEKREMLSYIRPQYLVLKPTLHGGVTGVREWIDCAKDLGIGYWLTSALESNVGLNSIAQFAATLNGAERWQGLGTGALFVKNVEHLGLSLKGEELWSKNTCNLDD